ncbi:MAG TPA: ATP-binding protein [Polyangiaceae bacterium]|jgi:DNA replication protein DnaC
MIVDETESVWGDDESPEPETELEPEPAETYVHVPAPPPHPCERCGTGRLYGTETHCYGCRQLVSIEDFKAKMVALARAPESWTDVCAGGCGMKLSGAGTCPDCEARQREESRRRGNVGATQYYLPARHKWAAFEAPELATRVRDKAAIEKAVAACGASMDRIVLSGLPGVGKTTLAACIAKRRALEHGTVGRYVTARQLMLGRSQSSLGSEATIVEEAIDAELLIIDDLGADDPQHHGSAVLDVVYERFAAEKPMIITLYIGIDEIEPRYGGGFGRRLLEPAAGHVYIDVRKLGLVQAVAK